MQMRALLEIKKDKKMWDLLKINSYWIKDLNRSGKNYEAYLNAMKDLYRLRTTDKISDAIDNIDLISSFLGAFKS